MSMDLMGYERDKNGKYPLIYGEKYGKIFLACKVEFHGNRFVRWLRNNNDILLPPPYSLPWINGSVLMVRPLIRGRTDGVYECIASNGHNTIRKGVNISIVEEKVKGFPKILTHPRHVRTLRNNVDFHCVVSGQPKMKIVWFHNRVPLPPSSAYNVSPTTNIGDEFSSNLMIKNVTKETKGFYQCIAMNSIGQAVSKQGNIRFRGEKRMWLRKKYRYRREVTDSNKCLFLAEEYMNDDEHVRSISVRATCEKDPQDPHQKGLMQKINWKDSLSRSDISDYCLMIRRNNMTTYDTAFQGKTLRRSDTEKLHNVTIVGISPSKKILSKGYVDTSSCPGELNVGPLPNIELSLGQDFDFTVTYNGGPVSEILWYFSEDFSHCKVKSPINSCYHKETCSIKNFTKKDAGCYTVRISETDSSTYRESNGFIHVKSKPVPPKDRNIVLPALGGVLGGILLIASIVLVRNKFLPSGLPRMSPSPAAPVSSVYISHCCLRDQHHRLLMFANILQKKYGIEVILDLTSEVDINRAGGMCQWLPQAMKRADRMMVVLSKSYLGMLNAKDEDTELCDPEACKVRAEFCEINRIIYHNLQNTNKLLIVSDDVCADKFPEGLKGRSSFPLPECASLEDVAVRQIAHVLCDQEMYQLPSQQNTKLVLTNNALEDAKDGKFEDVAL
jgi:hypothetical protein